MQKPHRTLTHTNESGRLTSMNLIIHSEGGAAMRASRSRDTWAVLAADGSVIAWGQPRATAEEIGERKRSLGSAVTVTDLAAA